MSEEPEDYSDIVGKPPAAKRGRKPMEMSQDVIDEICQRLADGSSLRSICSDKHMPSMVTVMKWLAQSPDFAKQYSYARELQADAIFDEVLDIADDGRNDWMEEHGKDSEGWKQNGEALQRSRLRIDARKWMAGKLRPKKYGEKLLLGEDADNPLQKPEATIDVFKLAEQLREAKRLSAVEPIELKALPKGDK